DDKEKMWYEKLEGIDHEEALKYCGSEDVLKTALETFYESIEEKEKELNSFFDSGDWKNYTTKIHALKTTALLIGAGKLAGDALSLEMAGKREDIDFIKQNHSETMNEFRAYLNVLGDLFGGKAVADDFIMDCLYDALKEGAEARDDGAISESFKEVEGYSFDDKNEELIGKIRDSFDRHDYEAMISYIDGRKGR
ncbi:MAG: hypothetical protein IKT17_10405, partial [Lachnospiraceae bacterium]|nr:hypothetical protein [Lachnospiraceae bacterium]